MLPLWGEAMRGIGEGGSVDDAAMFEEVIQRMIGEDGATVDDEPLTGMSLQGNYRLAKRFRFAEESGIYPSDRERIAYDLVE
jgi:hypothetical protein